MGLGAVLCLWFPAVLTTPALREIYDMTLIRALIKLGLLAAFLLGVASLLLKRRKALGLTGIALSALATLLGGSQVAVATPVARSSHVGLDWFLLNLLILATVFVPLEQLLARWPEQGLLRPGWRTDLAHFAVSHLLVQVTVRQELRGAPAGDRPTLRDVPPAAALAGALRRGRRLRARRLPRPAHVSVPAATVPGHSARVNQRNPAAAISRSSRGKKATRSSGAFIQPVSTQYARPAGR
jgi:hypothetical protein